MGGSDCHYAHKGEHVSAPRVHGWFQHIIHHIRPQRRLPRVRMDGSLALYSPLRQTRSAPRVHGWFPEWVKQLGDVPVCPACAWMVPNPSRAHPQSESLPRVCMDGSVD
mgnify:CR=1 FL=1